jgi:hypothetical protein
MDVPEASSSIRAVEFIYEGLLIAATRDADL